MKITELPLVDKESCLNLNLNLKMYFANKDTQLEWIHL